MSSKDDPTTPPAPSPSQFEAVVDEEAETVVVKLAVQETDGLTASFLHDVYLMTCQEMRKRYPTFDGEVVMLVSRGKLEKVTRPSELIDRLIEHAGEV